MSESLIVSNKNKLREQYKPDLTAMLSQCEINYWLLNQLIPELTLSGKQRALNSAVGTACNKPRELANQPYSGVSASKVCEKRFIVKTSAIQLVFTITDLAPYTTTTKLTINTPEIGIERELSLIVRLYHDVKMMEVMEGSGPSAMAAIYPANAQRKNVDEKRQVNQFVGECLKACFEKKVHNTTQPQGEQPYHG
ncbi:DUF1249 domain-containing protein [Aliikangiella maris]|uniref:DUF1249 domain-containing protein n=2 Tax=Aliikangiella maris TaxID=3162458 RepID=A0ABV2BXG0_9GAMM